MRPISGSVPLSSFGGEGRGEEVLYLCQSSHRPRFCHQCPCFHERCCRALWPLVHPGRKALAGNRNECSIRQLRPGRFFSSSSGGEDWGEETLILHERPRS